MALGEKYGRRLRVTVGGLLLCDVNPAIDRRTQRSRNLHVEVNAQGHVRIEPITTTITVLGLADQTLAQLRAQVNAAAKIPWTRFVDPTDAEAQQVLAGVVVEVVAGYQDDIGLIARGQILPDGLDDSSLNPGTQLVIKAQDNRLPWKNAFGEQSMAEGVPLTEIRRSLEASNGFLKGAEADEAFSTAFAEFQKVNPDGMANGMVLHGPTKDVVRELLEELNLEAFFVNGEYRYVNRGLVLRDKAVVWQRGRDFTSFTNQAGGFKQVTTLFEHRAHACRQIQLRDTPPVGGQEGPPIDGGVFRVEHVEHHLSSHDNPFYTTATLRPSSLSLGDLPELF
jgi:hypothetical protein